MKENVQNFDMPYEKFIEYGASSLSESELIAIILRTGTKDKSAIQLAREVLSLGSFPRSGLLGLYDISLEDLQAVKGVGLVKAVKLKALTELSMRMHRACASQGFRANSPEAVADYFMEELRHLENETVVLCGLDTKSQLLFHTRISEGSVNTSLISPRNVFIEALSRRAVYIILLHNHPSGDPEPSRTDIEFTDKVARLGKMLEIRLLDHIIIGDNIYYSFKENDLIP